MLLLLAKIYFISFTAIILSKFIYNLYFLDKERKFFASIPNLSATSAKLVIFIPLLNETRNFNKFISRFRPIINKHRDIKLVFITTNRENQTDINRKNTIDLVKDFINNLQGTESEQYIHIHYPDINTTLAEQLNYALKIFGDANKEPLNKIFYGFYNADSNIQEKTIDTLFYLINKYPEQAIFQQSSTFLQNHHEFSGLSGIILRTNGLLQTRWTFLHEIPRYFKSTTDNYWLIHCVTHGMFVESETIRKLGYFPTDSFGEDLYLGFIVRANKYTIKPLPVLEASDTPSTIMAMLRQKYVWFWGPLGYFYYWKRLKTKMPDVWAKNKKLILAITILGIMQSLNWVLAGWSFVIFLYCAFLIGQLTLGLMIALGYLWITTYLSGMLYNKYVFEQNQKISSLELTTCALLYPVLMFIHGLPPFFTIIKQIQLTLFPQKYLRPKTENN